MSKAHAPTGSRPGGDSDVDVDEGIEHVPIRRQEDGTYHVGDRGGPLGTGATETEAFFDYAQNVHAAIEGESVPISQMAYHGTAKRPVNYIFLDSETLADGTWHIEEIGGKIAGHGGSKTEARLNLAQLAIDVAPDPGVDE